MVEYNDELQKIEEELKQLEQENQSIPNFAFPSPEKKDSTLQLFRQLIESKDSRKFARLDPKELGNGDMSVRDYFTIANFLDSQGLCKAGDYLRNNAEIILSTSMSNKGWFGNLIVTQIKKEQKIIPTSPEKKGWLSFGKKEESQNQGDTQ